MSGDVKHLFVSYMYLSSSGIFYLFLDNIFKEIPAPILISKCESSSLVIITCDL